MSRFPANNSNSYVLGPSRQMHRLSANQDPGLEKDHLLGHRGIFWKSFLLRSSRGYSSLQLYQAANSSFLDFLISYMGDCVKVHVGLGFPGLCQTPDNSQDLRIASALVHERSIIILHLGAMHFQGCCRFGPTWHIFPHFKTKET